MIDYPRKEPFDFCKCAIIRYAVSRLAYGVGMFCCAASDVQCPILCSIRWSYCWLCHVSTTATQHSQGFLRRSSVAFSRCSTPPPDLYIVLLGMSTSHRCCKTFIGCGLRNASISSWLCSFTDACTVWRHGTFPTTSRASPTPTAAVFGRRHPRSWCRRTRLSTVGDRAFPVAGSRLWNSLPPDVTSAPTLTVFRNRLKTFLFSLSFPN